MGIFANLPDLPKEPKPRGYQGMFADLPDLPKVEPELEPAGFFEAAIRDPAEKFPFSPVGLVKTVKLLEASTRQRDFDYVRTKEDVDIKYPNATPADKRSILANSRALKTADTKLLTDHFDRLVKREKRGYTLMGRVGQIVSNMPAYMIEFLATGGLKTLGSAGARWVGTKILKESAKKGLGKAVVSVAKFSAGAGTRAFIGMPHRAAETILKRTLPKGITVDDLGDPRLIESGENVWTSIWKGTLDHYIEIASEQAGEFMGPAIHAAIGKMPLLGKAVGAMQRAWLKKFPTRSATDFIKKIGTKVGFHGVLGEIGEEDLGWIARALFDIEDFGAGKDASIGERLMAGLAQDIQNLPAELIAFSIPGLVGKGVSYLVPEDTPPIEPTPERVIEEVEERPGQYQVIEYDTQGMEKGPIDQEFDTKEEAQTFAEVMTESSFTPGTFEVRMAAKPVERVEIDKKIVSEGVNFVNINYDVKDKDGFDIGRATAHINKDKNEVVLTAFVVKEGHKRKGIGTAIINKIKEDFPNMAIRTEGIRTKEGELFFEKILARPPTTEAQMAAKPIEEEHEQTLGELAEALNKRQKKIETPIVQLHRGQIYKIRHGMASLGSNIYQNALRIERMLEGLDGHEEGTFYNKIWRPLKEADEFAIEATNRGMEEFIYRLEGQGIDITLWLGKVDEIGPGLKYTASERIGIYTLSKNKNGMRYLNEGMGLSPDNVKTVIEFMEADEKTIADWLLDQYETQWPTLKAAAIASGIDPKILKKEFRYSPVLRTDADLEQQDDFLSGLADTYTRDSFSPEKKMLKERQPGAMGEIELDAFVMYMHNIARTERFKAMAPTTVRVGKILNDKDFKRQLNAATYGHGSKILSTWLKDTVRGTSSAANTLGQKAIMIARYNGVVYAIGYNIPSSLRQTLSMNNAVAVDPLMLKYVPVNITKAMTPWGYKAIEQFVYNRSLLIKTRSFERDLRQKWNKSSLKKKLRRKAPWSQTATSWIKWMDRHTTVVAWKSLYDTAMEKFDGNETKAEQFADKWISRTQPMANTKDLPQFFRGSGLEKLLTTFQNQINQNGNFYAYDIIGAKRADKISWKIVGYRIMFSYILPAMLFGMIGRARPPKTWRDVMVDLSTYPIAPLLLVGRWIDRMIRGWGQSGTIAETGPEAAIRAVEAAKRGDIRGMMFNAARTVGAFTGRITAQMIRTTEGALDLLAGTTKDPRRLIYSKWALEQGKQKGQERGRRRKPGRKKPIRRTLRRR